MHVAVIACLAAVCTAGEADPLTLRIADASVLRSHWQASWLQGWWSDPGMAQSRAAWDVRLEAWRSQHGVDLPSLAHVVRGLQFCVLGPIAGPRRWASWGIQADVGTQAPQLARRLAAAENDAPSITLAGSDQAWSVPGGTLARFGGLIAVGRPPAAIPLVPAAPVADISLTMQVGGLLATLRAVMRPDERMKAEPLMRLVANLSTIVLNANLSADGIDWTGSVDGDLGWLRPADRKVLARLPANTAIVQAIGVHGPSLWAGWGPSLQAAIASDGADGPIARGGITAALRDLVEGLDGTIVLAHTPGVPIPGLTLALPRSQRVDAAVLAICQACHCPVPAEDRYHVLVVPDVPIPLHLVRGHGHWVVTTDLSVAAGWADSSGGLDATVLGGMITAAPAGACLVGVIDMSTVLRQLLGPMNQMLAVNQQVTPAERQAALTAVARLAAALPPGVMSGEMSNGRLQMRGHGGDLTCLTGVGALIMQLWPALTDGDVTANEAMAATILKSEIFPAQVQFQGGCYQDADGDNQGEFGLLSELGGRRATKIPAGQLHLLSGPIAEQAMTESYQFTCWLPDGVGGAIGELAGTDARPAVVAASDAQESRFVAYAWPRSLDDGGKVFALDQSGQVRVVPWDGLVPHWNALYGGGGWEDQPVWPVWQRPRRAR